ncbi:MAG: hypothetical protein ACK58N_16950 [Synechocystis sp.]
MKFYRHHTNNGDHKFCFSVIFDDINRFLAAIDPVDEMILISVRVNPRTHCRLLLWGMESQSKNMNYYFPYPDVT